MSRLKKIVKNLRYIIPVLIIIGCIAYAGLHLQVRGLPEKASVDENVVELLKSASKDQNMLTISGETDQFTYEWYYNKGSITSTEPTDLCLYPTDFYDEEVKELLQCSFVMGFELSDAFRMNGYPSLTVNLSNWNCIDCKVYRIVNDDLMEFASPAVNVDHGTVSVSFNVADVSGTYYIAAGFGQQSTQMVSEDENEGEDEEKNEHNSFLQNSEEGKEKQAVTIEAPSSSQDEGKENLEQNENTVSYHLGNDRKKPTKDVTKAKAKKDTSGSNPSSIPRSKHVNDSETNDFHLNTDLDYKKKKDTTSDKNTTNSKPDKTEQTKDDTSQKKSNTSSYKEDEKPSSRVSSLDGYAKKRLYSDGKQKGKDQYETDPVPEGKPLPVEPQDMSINYKKTHVCKLSVDVHTILDNKKNLVSGKDKYVPDDGWIYKEKEVLFYEGESVYDVLKREMEKANIQMEVSWTPAYNSVYVEGINNLYEFDCGELSGWMYKVNGWYPNYGASRYLLQDGDVIHWRYTCDLGRDVGCDWDLTK